MDTGTKLRQYLGGWIKASPLADQTHCILRYDALVLVAYCGTTIPLTEASKPVRGARHCVDCEGLRRKHLTDRSAHYAAARK